MRSLRVVMALVIPLAINACEAEEGDPPEMPFEVGTSEAASGFPVLRFQATASWNVPASVAVVEGALLGDGRAIVKGSDGTFLHFASNLDHPEQVIFEPSARLVGNGSPHLFSAAVVNPDNGTILLLSGPQTIVKRIISCEAVRGLRAGSAFGSQLAGLFYMAVDRIWELRLVEITDDRCVVRATTEVRLPGTGADVVMPDSFQVVLAPKSPDEPLVGAWISDGFHVQEFPASIPPEFGSPDVSNQVNRLAVLPILLTDRGLMRVVPDVSSEYRRFEFWDRSLTHRRTSRLVAPIGFSSTLPERRRVLALRGRGSKELVIYHWEWATSGE